VTPTRVEAVISYRTKRVNEMIPIETKIRSAHELFQRADVWRGDHRIRTLLDTLQRAVEASRKAIQEVGIDALCRQCEVVEGGSCCGAGIEDRYDPVLLAINLLLGGTLPEVRNCAKGCFFLREIGCSLVIRHVLCVNYLCLKIQKALPLEALIRVQTATGTELDTAFLLQEAIKKHMNR